MATDTKGAVGLLITNQTITAVQARIARGRVEVVARGTVETPRGSMEGASIADAAVVGQAIRGLIRQLDIKAKSASVALVTPAYSMRPLRLPEVPVQERRALVRGEMEETGTLPFGSDAFDFLWTPTPAEPGRRQADAFVYYASDMTADGAREALRAAGLQMERLEPASLALMRACLVSASPSPPIAMLCPARKYSDLCIFDGVSVRNVRRIASGWEDFMRPPVVETTLYASPTLPPPASIGGWPAAEESEDVLTEPPVLVQDVPSDKNGAAPETSANATFLTSEVARSLAFFAREFPDAARPQALVVLGPESFLQTMQAALRNSLPLPVRTENLLDAFDMPAALVSTGGEDFDYLTAIGVAVGGKESLLPSADLSQQEKSALARRKAPVALFAGMAGSTVWMVVSAAAALTLTVLETNLAGESSRVAAEISKVQAERAPILRKQEIWTATKALQSRAQAPAASTLGRIAASTTPGVALTTVKVSHDGKIAVEGKAASTEAMQRFAFAMGQGKVIKAPIFESIKQDAKEGLTFRITSVFRAPQAAEPAKTPENAKTPEKK